VGVEPLRVGRREAGLDVLEVVGPLLVVCGCTVHPGDPLGRVRGLLGAAMCHALHDGGGRRAIVGVQAVQRAKSRTRFGGSRE
jgi:hypothetical protein